MKTRHNRTVWATMCAITLIAQHFAWGQETRGVRALPPASNMPSVQTQAEPEKLPRENVRLVLEITTTNQPTATFAIVNNGQSCQMDNIVEIVQIDDMQIPIILHFATYIERADESTYKVDYTYGMQVPMITQVSGPAQSSPQFRRSSFEYRDIGSKSSVSLNVGKKLELFRDPQRTVTLELQNVGDDIADSDLQLSSEDPKTVIIPFLGNWKGSDQSVFSIKEDNSFVVSVSGKVVASGNWKVNDKGQLDLNFSGGSGSASGELKGNDVLYILASDGDEMHFTRQ